MTDLVRGILLGLVLHGVLLVTMVVPVFGFMLLMFIGVSQLVYIIPACVIYARQGRRDMVKGLIIAASITFLLNAACWGALTSGKLGRIAG